MNDIQRLADLERVFASLPDGILVVDATDRVHLANAAAAALLGRHGETLVGGRSGLPVPPAARAEVEMSVEDGVRYLDIVAVPIAWTGLACHLVTLRDISAVRRAAVDTQLHGQRLAQAQRQAAVTTLITAMGHEISNPNAMIGLNVEFIDEIWAELRPALKSLSDAGSPLGQVANMPVSEALIAVGESLRDIGKGSRRIRNIIDELREFSRTEDGERRAEVDLCELTERTLRLLMPRLSRSGAGLDLHIGGVLPALWADALQIEQILFNLIDNAIDAVAPDGGMIKLELLPSAQDRGVDLRIEDDGRGIPSAVREQAFAPFATAGREGGVAALGLRSTRRLVEAHGGSIAFEPRQPRGTVCRVHFPAVSANDHPAANEHDA